MSGPEPPTAAAPLRRPVSLALVVAGGAVGTTVRALIESRYAAPAGGFPWATFGINVAGALLLGILVEALALVGPGEPARQRLRLTLGTGLLGGFTTYSTFVVESVSMATTGGVTLAAGYDIASILAGYVAAFGGMAAVSALAGPTAGAGDG